MSRPKPTGRKNASAELSRRTRISLVVIALLGLGAIAAMLFLPNSTTVAPVTTPASNAPPAVAAANGTESNRPPEAPAKPKLAAFVGRWQRTDGTYAIEIQSVAADGEMRAGYFNPNPIHVARAEAFEKDGRAQMYLELRDQNYPGSYYALAYDPTNRMLSGIYFQAVDRETYEVEFVRFP